MASEFATGRRYLPSRDGTTSWAGRSQFVYSTSQGQMAFFWSKLSRTRPDTLLPVAAFYVIPSDELIDHDDSEKHGSSTHPKEQPCA